jgi:hypothetical protein
MGESNSEEEGKYEESNSCDDNTGLPEEQKKVMRRELLLSSNQVKMR